MSSLKPTVFAVVILVVLFCAASVQTQADTLNITGSLSVSTTGVDFLPAGTGVGTFNVDQFTQTGIFVPVAGTTGTAIDLNFMAAPINQTFLLSNFLTFAANPNLRFNLTFINLGVSGLAGCAAPPAVGQSCTPAFPSLVTPANPLGLTPFNFTNVPVGSSTLSFAVAGNVNNNGVITPFTGTFSTQFSTVYQQVLATISTGGSVSSTYSATFQTPGSEVSVPEPATLLLFSIGLGGTLVCRRGKA